MNRALWAWLASAAAMFAQQPSDRFYTAIRNNDLPTLRMLVKDHGANLADSRAQSPLMIAAAYGSLESFKFLLDSGADAKAVNGFGTTALHLSAGNIDKIRLLLDRGADVNAKSQIGRTPLMVAAATHGASAVVKALLQKGAEVDAADAQGSTALQLAAGSGDLTSVRTLLERGADPNAKQRFGWTALMKSAGHGDLEIVRLLIAHNVDVNAVSGPDDGRVKHGPTVMGT